MALTDEWISEFIIRRTAALVTGSSETVLSSKFELLITRSGFTYYAAVGHKGCY